VLVNLQSRLQIFPKQSNLLPYTCCQLAGALGNVKSCSAGSNACVETIQVRKQFEGVPCHS
jgi:hypothetical protein